MLIVIIPSMIADEVSVPLLRYAQKWDKDDTVVNVIIWAGAGAFITVMSEIILCGILAQYRDSYSEDLWIPWTISSGIGTALSIAVPLVIVSPPNKVRALGGSIAGSLIAGWTANLVVLFILGWVPLTFGWNW